MSLITAATRFVERAPIPDALSKLGVAALVDRTSRSLSGRAEASEVDFVRDMGQLPVALHVQAANQQHYELPADFFALTLGPARKYSCCLYPTGEETLAQAETLALEATVERADLKNGQKILELGCGWGSLSLFMAERFPAARITAVSNSASQRRFIEQVAADRGLANLRVVTADMNEFEPGQVYDRVVSVEMFEHMANWSALLARVRTWLAVEGRLFVHVFTHRRTPYRFDNGDDADWIAQHFFTGGIMPSHGLMMRFPQFFAVEQDWRWSGSHYQRTALDWLDNFDRNRTAIDTILAEVYGADADLWRRRWRLFFLATAGLFGHANGDEWGVSHYRLRPT
jgi:cyclopropane-fatty-acyl-phospholipid synthase